MKRNQTELPKTVGLYKVGDRWVMGCRELAESLVIIRISGPGSYLIGN